jgi:hypothetical protein
MPKSLAGCHDNEFFFAKTNGNKFATDQILKKLVEVVKGGF